MEESNFSLKSRMKDMIMETGRSRDREHRNSVRALEETAQIHHDAVAKGHTREFEEHLQLLKNTYN
eukprot:5640572-Prorocentrum_lima.AAC.1